MAIKITEECINCGACEPECPNTAIYQGGVEWLGTDGAMHPAISNDIFYIVPEKCTECVGFFDHEACAAVCPVDCCVPDPQRPESQDVLLQRARAIPRRDFDIRFGLCLDMVFTALAGRQADELLDRRLPRGTSRTAFVEHLVTCVAGALSLPSAPLPREGVEVAGRVGGGERQR